MKQWTATCALSRLPILYGDPIVLFILRYDEPDELYSHGSFANPEELYTPASMAIFGKYDGIGGIADAEPDSLRLATQAFHSATGRMKMFFVSDESILTTEEDLSKISIEVLLHYINTGKVCLLREGPERPLKQSGFGLIMFHREIYDELLEKYGQTEAKGLKDRKRSLLADIREELEQQVSLVKRLNVLWSDFEMLRAVMDSVHELSADAAKLQKAWDEKSTEVVELKDKVDELQETLGECGFYNGQLFQQFLHTDWNSPGSEVLFNTFVDFQLFRGALVASRLAWMPQYGNGNYDSETWVQETLAQYMLRNKDKS